jgi:hypothetical protein
LNVKFGLNDNIRSDSINQIIRINENSVLKNVVLDDADSIRAVMGGLDYYLTNRVLRLTAPELRNTTSRTRCCKLYPGQAFKTTKTIPSSLKPLYFVEARNGDSKQVLVAARDLENLATGIDLAVPAAYPAEYADAQALFNRTRAVDNFSAAHQSLRQRVRTLSSYKRNKVLPKNRLLVR